MVELHVLRPRTAFPNSSDHHIVMSSYELSSQFTLNLELVNLFICLAVLSHLNVSSFVFSVAVEETNKENYK